MSFEHKLSWLVSVALGIIGITVPASSFADTNSVTIVRTTIYMGSTYTGALITISPAYPGLGGCLNSAGQYVFIDFSAQTAPSGRDLYASVLAAFLAGRTVSFGTTGCSSDGWYPLARAVGVDP